MTVQLDGPRLAPSAGGAPQQLVIFLHGYGADGNDLIELGREWARALPHAAFVSPHAPEALAWRLLRRAAMVRPRNAKRARVGGGRAQGPARAGGFHRSRSRAPEVAARRGGARGFQPGNHDGAANGPPPERKRRPPSWGFPGTSRARRVSPPKSNASRPCS